MRSVEPPPRWQRLKGMKGLGIAVTMLALVAACSPSHRASRAGTTTTSRSTTATLAVSRGDADPAVWLIRSREDVRSGSSTFTAQVSRLGCNGGVTGTVLHPTVKTDEAEVVVTFTVKPADSGAHTCQGNVPVPVAVHLGEAIGHRHLVDGACRSGAPASRTAWCVADGSVRWKP
jgi:hypothetical protein